jgi:protein tyrosine phosphatase
MHENAVEIINQQSFFQDLKEGRMVRLIQYMSWPDHGVPKDVDDIVKLLSEVEESQRAAEGKGPVIVICR